MKKKYFNLFIFKLIAIVSIVLDGRGANAKAGDDVACSVNREIGIQPNDSFTCSTENMEYGEPVRFTAAFCQSCYTEEDLTEFSEEKRKSVTCSVSLDSEDVTSAESRVSCSYTTKCKDGYEGPDADSVPYNNRQPNAHCTIIQYIADLGADDCAGSRQQQEGIDYVTYDIENLTVQLPTPEKENYSFVGWCKAVAPKSEINDDDMASLMGKNATNNETGYKLNKAADDAGGLSFDPPIPCDNPIPAGPYEIPEEELGRVKFYAQWEPVKLQLTYHHYEKNNEQNIDVEEITQKTTGDMCNVGDTFTPPNIQENAVPKGYKFMGWRKIKSSCKTCRTISVLG